MHSCDATGRVRRFSMGYPGGSRERDKTARHLTRGEAFALAPLRGCHRQNRFRPDSGACARGRVRLCDPAPLGVTSIPVRILGIYALGTIGNQDPKSV